MDSVSSDEVYQDQILPHVSRTFALTIPQLPAGLRTAVTCAYLLCRIADTIEDEPALSPPETLAFLQRFSAVLAGRGDPEPLAREIEPRLSDRTLPTERDLVSNMERVIGVHGAASTRRSAPRSSAASSSCAMACRVFSSARASRAWPGRATWTTIATTWPAWSAKCSPSLFCDYSPQIARQPRGAVRHRRLLCAGAADDEYPQGRVGGPQPRRLLAAAGGVHASRRRSRAMSSSEPFDPRFGAGMRELVGVAHAHLRNALDYTLLIPGKETGIRRFCLWAIGLAVLTLRKIEHNPRFTAGAQVKVTRSAVAMTRMLTNVAGRSDWMLRLLFAQAARGLPLARLADLRRPRPAPAEPRSKRRSMSRSTRCAAPTGTQDREPHRAEAGYLPGTAAGSRAATSSRTRCGG